MEEQFQEIVDRLDGIGGLLTGDQYSVTDEAREIVRQLVEVNATLRAVSGLLQRLVDTAEEGL